LMRKILRPTGPLSLLVYDHGAAHAVCWTKQ
jgi:hypothetical protein